MSLDNNLSLNQSAQTSQLIRQTKISSGVVNNELLKNIEILDAENTQLKAALSELQEDLKDKENSIEESHKIITKLKDEYSKLIKEYQNLEQINNELVSENELNKKVVEGSKKANELISKLQKQTNDLISETNILKKENLSMKSKLISNSNTTNKKDQDLKDRDLIITDLKEKADNWVTMIKDREQLINEQSKKIRELNELIARKDDQLKLMVNFSKEINKENKSNVAELTKQAVKTIKVFYNTLNNNARNTIDNGYRVEFKNSNTTFQDFEPILKNKRTSFSLEDAIQGMMYIPTDLKSISKEFLMDMNFKTELIKSELFASLIREIYIVKFLEEVFSKLNIKDSENIKNISQKVIALINNYDMTIKENQKLKEWNKILIQDKNNSDLFLKKFKDDVKNTMNKLKERYIYLTSNIDNKVQNIKNSNIIIKEKARKDNEKLKAEILLLKKENNKLKDDIEELKKLLDTQKENEKLFKALEEKELLNNQNNNNNQNKIPWNTVIQSVPVNSFNYIYSNATPKLNDNNFGFSNINQNNNINNINNINEDNKFKNDNLRRNNNELNNNNNKFNSNDINYNSDDINNYNDINNNTNNNDNKINNFDNNDINQINDENNNYKINNRNKNKNINKKYHKKKKEINNLKEQIGRVKDEINNIMLNSNNPDFNISNNFLSSPKKDLYKETNTNSNMNLNNNDINARTYTLKNNNINERNNTNTNTNNNIVENLNKKIEDLQKALNKEKNKNINLEKEIVSLKEYIDNLNNDLAQQEYINNNREQIINNNIFTPKFFIKMFYNINPKVFSSSELKKYYKIYNTQNINTIFDIFGKTCDCLKRQMYESHFEIDTVNTDIEDTYMNSRNIAIDSSYRLVNERILKLKKLEFDFINLSEFVKNYLVSQEIIVKIIFSTDNNIIQFEPIEKLFNLFEDCLNFKIDEMNDNVIFHRKLLIKMLKNQKNCLGLSLESMAQE